jgi:hypothetical protein
MLDQELQNEVSGSYKPQNSITEICGKKQYFSVESSDQRQNVIVGYSGDGQQQNATSMKSASESHNNVQMTNGGDGLPPFTIVVQTNPRDKSVKFGPAHHHQAPQPAMHRSSLLNAPSPLPPHVIGQKLRAAAVRVAPPSTLKLTDFVQALQQPRQNSASTTQHQAGVEAVQQFSKVHDNADSQLVDEVVYSRGDGATVPWPDSVTQKHRHDVVGATGSFDGVVQLMNKAGAIQQYKVVKVIRRRIDVKSTGQ